jgi:SAM-dependent methyltransferase
MTTSDDAMPMKKEFWDQRYSEPGFAYGMEPNAFFVEVLESLTPGRLLLPGEGEGKNAIHAAGNGWEVSALDQSIVARDKAREWADSMDLQFEYRLANLEEFYCPEPIYDLIAIIYIHLLPETRQQVHRQLSACLKPGGKIILECFHKNQLTYATGGPPIEELLYHEDEIRSDFRDLDTELCEEQVLDIFEGKYHSGKSSVVRLIANKPI